MSPEPTKTTKAPQSEPHFESAAALDQALKAEPDVRQEEVERATRLVETKNYPPPELINRLSRLLAEVITEPQS
ncbi:MAG: hypothetical protein JNN07_11315 [Verrucomicrobiales bacterium]|nr:hypothetical protein [Verrucomicrobiales bacterium]